MPGMPSEVVWVPAATQGHVLFPFSGHAAYLKSAQQCWGAPRSCPGVLAVEHLSLMPA